MSDAEGKGASARREAISKGLAAVLSEAQVRQGLVLWDQIFATREAQSIPHFIEILGTILRLNERDRAAARLSIMRELMSTTLGDHLTVQQLRKIAAS